MIERFADYGGVVSSEQDRLYGFFYVRQSRLEFMEATNNEAFLL